MDLLGSYGSDAESDASEGEEEQRNNGGRAVLSAPQASLNIHGTTESAPKVSRTGLFAALPPPKSKGDGLEKEESRYLFAALPRPKATFEPPMVSNLQNELGLKVVAEPTFVPPKKGVVQFRPPIDTSLLNKAGDKDDDIWQPPRKKMRNADAAEEVPPEKKPSKPSFSSFLPPPKNNLGAGNILGGGASGGRKMAMDTATGLDLSEERPRIQLDSSEGAPSRSGQVMNGSGELEPNLLNANGGAVEAGTAGSQYPPESDPGYQSHLGHIAASVLISQPMADNQTRASSGYQPPYPSDPSANPYIQSYPAPQFPGVTNVWQSDAPPGGSRSVDLLAELMEEDARKMRRGGGRAGVNGPQVVEVKQADITTGSYRREDMLKSSASVFGPQAQPVSSAKDAGPKKLERRKHQISSLYADMKKKEMEMMDSRAAGVQTKSQTKGKYGW